MMNDNVNSHFAALGAEELSLISALVQEQVALAAQIAAAERELKALQEAHRAIECSRLPDAMADLGLSELKLLDGSKLVRVTEYHPAIAVANRRAAYDWLRTHGCGDLIKNQLTLTFSRGEEEAARQRYTTLAQAEPFRKIQLEETVHPSTLKALVKERAEGDEPLPRELFGVYELTRAVLKPPK